MPPRLRPEVIIPLRTSAGWGRSLLLSCCAFIMFVTTVDALRYASHRNTRAREAAARQQIEQLQRTFDVAGKEARAQPTRLCRVSGHPAISVPCRAATSPAPH